MKKAAVLTVVSLGGILALGCAPNLQQFAGRQRNQAPSSKGETGIIVRGADVMQMTEILQRHTQAQFRVLNEAHQMYEIYGIEAADLQGELPQAEISPNTFIAKDEEAMGLSDRLQLLANEKPPGELEKCISGENPPQAVIEIKTLSAELKKRLLQENSMLELSAASSVNKQFPKEPLKSAWVVMAPRGAKAVEELFNGPTLKYKTEALGGYGIGLIVQDSRKVCSLDLVEFAVTANRKFVGRNPASNLEQLTKLDLKKFQHLDRVHAFQSAKLSQGEGKVIAIIDSGVNFNHIALRDNILINEKEIADNGVDDDGNGFTDDNVGWDFNLSDSSPFDDVGHGSHVAGLAASSAMGMARKAKILPVKAVGAFGGDVGSIAAAIRYAVDRGANIINLSLGGHSAPKKELIDAIAYAESKGVLLVTAAGNGHPMTGIGLDVDQFPVYPGAMPNQNILNVAARGSENELSTYSNFGAKNVDVAAPGGDKDSMIVSTFLENPAGQQFQPMSGTSMASPIVAGIAAQVWSLNPTMSALQVKERLMSTGPTAPELAGLVQSGRWIDSLAALQPTSVNGMF